MNDLLTKDELGAIAFRRNVMGGFISYAHESSTSALIAAFDDSERLQTLLESLQKEVIELRERVETQKGMIEGLLNDLHP